MNIKYTFSSVALQFAAACDLAVLYFMLTAQSSINWLVFPGVILIYGPLVYGINRIFLKRERDLRELSFFNTAMMIIMTVLCILADGWRGAGTFVFLLLSVIWLTVEGALFAAGKPEIKQMLLGLDITALILVAFAVYSAFFGLEPISGILMTLGFISVCFGTAVRRCGRALGIRGWVFTLAAFFIISLIMLIILGIAAVPADQGIVAGVWNGLAGTAASLDSILLRLIQPLAALFPRIKQEEIIIQNPNTPNAGNDSLFVEGSIVGMGSVFLVLAAVILICAVFVFIKMGSIKIGDKKYTVKKENTEICTKKKTSVPKLFEPIKMRFKVYRYMKKNKDTPQELYLYLLKTCKKEDLRKKTDETPREFLARLAEKAKDSPETTEALTKLIPEVEKAFYLNNNSEKFSYAESVRKGVRKI